MKPIMMVTFRIAKEKEQEFNEFYEQYLPKIMKSVPELLDATRFVADRDDENTYYATVYQLESKEVFDKAKEHLSSPERAKDVADWHVWEDTFMKDVTFGFYELMYPTKTRSDYGL